MARAAASATVHKRFARDPADRGRPGLLARLTLRAPFTPPTSSGALDAVLSKAIRPCLEAGRRRCRLAGLVTTTLALGLPAPAQASASGLVISEIFGGNGSGNLYNQDYVEIYNPTSGPINTAGWSVQYRAATSTVDLLSDQPPGLIPAGSRFLAGGQAVTGGISIPTPDAGNNSMSMAAGAGVVILARTSSLLTNAPIGTGTNNPLIEDLVGYGTTANIFEGATHPPAPAPRPPSTGRPATPTSTAPTSRSPVLPIRPARPTATA